MASVNKAIILGRLGQDPDIRYTASGTAVANLSVATSESWKDKNSGEKQEKTEWHRVTAFGKLAEIMGDYLKKGQLVYLEGRIETSQYQKEGVDHYSTKIIASDMQMLGGRESVESRPEPAKASRPAPAPADVPFDEDLPF